MSINKYSVQSIETDVDIKLFFWRKMSNLFDIYKAKFVVIGINFSITYF